MGLRELLPWRAKGSRPADCAQATKARDTAMGDSAAFESVAPASAFLFGPANSLDNSMRQTARARFAAAKRLQARDRKITRLTAFTSAYLIALTIIPYFLELPPRVDDHINLGSAFMGVVVLVSSLLQYSRSDVVAAEQHHRSALEINELVREFAAERDVLTSEQYVKMSSRYNHVLHKYSVNHEDVDWYHVLLNRVNENPWITWRLKWVMKLLIIYDRMVPDIILIAITMGMGIAIMFYILPNELPELLPASRATGGRP
jgi:hypothetical protein